MSTDPLGVDSQEQDAPAPPESAAVRAAVDAYLEANEAGGARVDSGADGAGAEPDQPQHSAEELRVALDAARAEVESQREQMLRARADLENIKRRHAAELEKAHKFALDGFVRELLQVRDSLELGHLAAMEQRIDVEKLKEGTELTLKLLTDVMDKFGVAMVDPLNQPFDPAFHQAMSMQPRSDVPPSTVVAVVQKGYTLNGRLVRPALVMVSQQGT